MTERLKNSIENLYQIFEKYKTQRPITGSPLHEDRISKWNLDIFSKPLNKLEAESLLIFSGKAMTTWGNKNDFKHFLPRILELIAELNPPYEVDIIFGKIKMAEFDNWEESERNTIYEYVYSLWESLINDNSEKAKWEFKDYFMAIFDFSSDITKFLKIWEESESKTATRHLVEFLVDDYTLIFKQKELSNSFISWILSDKMLNKIQEKYFEFESESFAEKISWAEQIITTERKITAHNKGYT